MPNDALFIPSRYRCKERSIWFPLEWGQVPRRTGEIVVVIGVQKITRKGGGVSTQTVNEFLIGGLNPRMRKLQIGPIPKGAFITQYSSPGCPVRQQESGLSFAVYAMPQGRHLQAYEAVGYSTLKALGQTALAKGSFGALYGTAHE